MSGAVLILCAVPDEATAARLADALVGERLAACVQALPVRSWYRWQGAVVQADERQLHVKTAAALADRATARLRALHPYAVPEIVVLPIAGGDPAYLAWIAAETG